MNTGNVIDPILATVQVDVICAYRTVLDSGWFCPRGNDPFSRLYYIESGRAEATLCGRTRALVPKRAYIIPAHTTFSYHCPRYVTIQWVHFTAGLQSGMDLFDCYECDYEYHPSRPQDMQRLLRRLRMVWNVQTSGALFTAKGLMLQLLAPFLDTRSSTTNAPQQKEILRFKLVFDAIEGNLQVPPRVPDLARLVHLEPSYFSRTFLRYFGLPPKRYILHQRIKRARLLLWQTDHTMEEIARQLGFTDGFHLSKTFKHITGMSPSQYRLQARQKSP